MAGRGHPRKKGLSDPTRQLAGSSQEDVNFGDLFDQHIRNCPEAFAWSGWMQTNDGELESVPRMAGLMPSDNRTGARNPWQLHANGNHSGRSLAGGEQPWLESVPGMAGLMSTDSMGSPGPWPLQRNDSGSSTSFTGESQRWPETMPDLSGGERQLSDALPTISCEFGDLEFGHLELDDDAIFVSSKGFDDKMVWSSPAAEIPPGHTAGFGDADTSCMPRATACKVVGMDEVLEGMVSESSAAGSEDGEKGREPVTRSRAKQGKKRGAARGGGSKESNRVQEGSPSQKKEVRVVRQRASEVFDVIQDGHHWRKYGQKGVKGQRHPRNYYKCSFDRCGARKQVETNTEGVVMTTYEGTHNHPMPPPSIPSYLVPLLQGLLTGERPEMPAFEEEWFEDACRKLAYELKDTLELRNARLKKMDSAAERAVWPGGNNQQTPTVEK